MRHPTAGCSTSQTLAATLADERGARLSLQQRQLGEVVAVGGVGGSDRSGRSRCARSQLRRACRGSCVGAGPGSSYASIASRSSGSRPPSFDTIWSRRQVVVVGERQRRDVGDVGDVDGGPAARLCSGRRRCRLGRVGLARVGSPSAGLGVSAGADAPGPPDRRRACRGTGRARSRSRSDRRRRSPRRADLDPAASAAVGRLQELKIGQSSSPMGQFGALDLTRRKHDGHSCSSCCLGMQTLAAFTPDIGLVVLVVLVVVARQRPCDPSGSCRGPPRRRRR